MRSPSQCPGTARSSTSAGRSLISTSGGDMSPRSLPGPGQGNTQRPPGPQAGDQLALQRAPALDSAPARGDRQARDRRRRDPGARACRQRGSGHAAPATALRPVRPHPGEQAGAQAREPLLRAGGGRPRLRAHRAAGRAPRHGASRAEGSDHRRIGRRRYLRRADLQGLRRRDHRRVQHGEDRPGLLRRSGPRNRLHARGLRRRAAPLRRHPRHRRRQRAGTSAPGPRPSRQTRHGRERGRGAVARRHGPPAPCAPALPAGEPAAEHVHRVGELPGPEGPPRSHRVRKDRTGHRPDLPAQPDPSAIRHVQNGRARGKVVLTIWRVACQPTLRGERPLLPL
jgi:hypothetical protein